MIPPEPRPAVLAPGNYLLELEMIRAVGRSTILTALYNAGFRDFHLDHSFGGTSSAFGEGMPAMGSKTRVVASLTEPAQLAHIPGKVKWTLVHKLRVNPRVEQAAKIGGAAQMIPLLTGRIYESRILTNNKIFRSPKPASIEEVPPDQMTDQMKGRVWTALRMLGHEPLKLVEMRRQLRLPNKPGAMWSEWLAWTRWSEQSGAYVQHPALVVDEIAAM